MFSKKSEMIYQVFIYIIAILLFSLVLVYGYNAIKGFREKSEQIAYIKFKTDLTSTIKRVSPDYGTIKKEEFFIGGEYTKVCFVKSYNPDKNAILSAIMASLDKDMIIHDSIEGGTGDNTFLLTGTMQESFDIGKIDVEGVDEGGLPILINYLCIDIINGKAKIQFQGMGDHTLISQWG